ncbi:hypothetical protein Pint_16987 [Pistacia integerrima]|uniref:Uncharacterized protein n=1 Tax=Pistacia integerrima TaxID=434235 RepID=A0ACC0ZCE3_9ROSI|nr:hypothetical protein Pint_16987 [Pistacia integerrima]
MAESTLFSIATNVPTTIGSLVNRQASLLWKLESDLKSLEGTLKSIKAVILDAEKKQAQNDRPCGSVRKLKDVLLDAEDVLEEFEFQAPGWGQVVRQNRSTIRKVSQFFSSSNPFALDIKLVMKSRRLEKG